MQSNGQSMRGQKIATAKDRYTSVDTTEVLAVIGSTVRSLREAQGLTLGELADRTQLSKSMLSLVERGKSAPSIGSLVAISSVFGVQLPELLGKPKHDQELITRLADQTVVKTRDGVTHRTITNDQVRGIEIAFNQYKRGASNSLKPITHDGFEYGVVLDGKLEIVVADQKHAVSAGDLICYPSDKPHRITSKGPKGARALWITVRRT
jgi:transcriptional regulator with XRE-family HTH domain